MITWGGGEHSKKSQEKFILKLKNEERNEPFSENKTYCKARIIKI